MQQFFAQLLFLPGLFTSGVGECNNVGFELAVGFPKFCHLVAQIIELLLLSVEQSQQTLFLDCQLGQSVFSQTELLPLKSFKLLPVQCKQV